MGAVDDNELYPIGDVARRTGLSVSAIRFYSDAGVVTPTGHTDGGYRLYDFEAIARLELVRTLRGLGAGLDEIRRLLADETTLHELATTNLALVETQIRRLRARRSVLRTIVKQHGTAEQVSLMHKLVSMSDDDRDRLIEEFWNEVTDGLEIRPAVVDRLRNLRPTLPEEPTTEQLEAWVELADLVRDAAYRRSIRQFFHDTFSTRRAAHLARPAGAERIQKGQAILLEARAASQAGLPADSAPAQDIAKRYVSWIAELYGEQDPAALRLRIAALDPAGAESRRAAQHGARAGSLFGRYTSLVDRINGKTQDEQDQEKAANVAASEWLTTAIKAAGPHGGAGEPGRPSEPGEPATRH